MYLVFYLFPNFTVYIVTLCLLFCGDARGNRTLDLHLERVTS